MIPNPNEVSAFAVYSGLVGESKSRKRRERQKRMAKSSVDTHDEEIGEVNDTERKKNGYNSGSKKKGIISISRGNNADISSSKKRRLVNLNHEDIEESGNLYDKSINENSKNSVKVKKKVPVGRGPKKTKGLLAVSKRKNAKINPPKKVVNLNEEIEDSGNSNDESASECAEPNPGSKQKGGSKVSSKQINSQISDINSLKRQRKNSSSSPSVKSFDIQTFDSSSDDITIVNEPSETIVKSASKKKEAYKEKVAADIALKADKKKLLQKEVKQQMKGRSSTSSVNRGKTVFEQLISPFKVENFFSEYWEKKPLYIDRGGDDDTLSHYLSTAEIDTMLRYNMLMFGRNIDITSYTDGVRETHNPEGRAHPHVVWDYYSNGCSVRILNPQTYLSKIHTLLAALQEYFGCFVGSNIYLTPANTQGFAPHYDDIEAFVLQVEGSKRWRVYSPLSASEELPRFSSRNFSQDEIGSPLLDIILKPGDLLYFPRGFVHQAEALPDQHSLHITVSTYQKTSWLDLLELALPAALTRAGEQNVEFRRGLPIGYLRGAGLACSSASLKSEMTFKLRKLVHNLEKFLDVDDAVDKLGITFVHQSLPPVLSKDESECSVHNGGLKMSKGELVNRVDLALDTKIRWIRANAFRIVEDKEEVNQVRLYHSVDNSKEYEAEDAQFLVLDKDLLPAILFLARAYPTYVPVCRLPCSSDDEKLVLAGDLWDRGLIISERPLQAGEEPTHS